MFNIDNNAPFLQHRSAIYSTTCGAIHSFAYIWTFDIVYVSKVISFLICRRPLSYLDPLEGGNPLSVDIYPDNKVHGANMGPPVGPRWAPCWPHEPCYRGSLSHQTIRHALGFAVNCVVMLTHWGRTNGRYFADDVFKCIFLNENVWILLKISLRFVPKVPINNIPVLVQMAWRRRGDKPLSEPIQWWLVYWRIYASLGLNELIMMWFIYSAD